MYWRVIYQFLIIVIIYISCDTGEVVIAEAQNVLMFAPVSEQKQGKSGTLSVTNFKLSFVTTEDYPRDVS